MTIAESSEGAEPVRNSHRDHYGNSQWERQRLAFIAGVAQAAKEQTGAPGHWNYSRAGTRKTYARGLEVGRDTLAKLLFDYGY